MLASRGQSAPLRVALWAGVGVCAAVGSAGCGGPQSTLAPAGTDAATVASMFWWMSGGAVVVWLLVMGSAIWAIRHQPSDGRETANRFIVLGGVVLPTVVLTGLLAMGLRELPGLLELGPGGGPAISVSAEQWWWRVRYETSDGRSFETANELRLPRGARTAVALTSPDVVHSLWVPALAGKVDAIPGRTTRLAFEPLRAGEFRGVCAEYCGVAHAQMTFDAIVMEPEAYLRWISQQAAPASDPSGEAARRGAKSFLELGCGACHAVRGTDAGGVVASDLTHVASRRRVAGVIPTDASAFARWIEAPQAIKPSAHMPAFSMLSRSELDDLAAYLDQLR